MDAATASILMADWVSSRWRARIAPVRVRVTLVAMVVVAVALCVGGFALSELLRGGLLRSATGTGPERASELAALAARGQLPNPLPSLDAPRLTLVQVVADDGTVTAASSQLSGLTGLVAPNARHRRVVAEIAVLGEGPWLIEPTPATIANRSVTVVVITSLAEMERSMHLVNGLLLVSVPLLVALSGTVVWLVAGRSLRPVEMMRSEVADITAHDLARRVSVPQIDDEVGRLGVTLNDLLDRVEAASVRQRRFAADASHELRTPIANIRVELEVAVAHPEHADWPAVAATVLHEDERMERLVSSLLAAARADSGQLPQNVQFIEMATLVRDVTADVRRSDARVVLVEPLAATTVHGDRDQLERVVANLVDNARRHASSLVRIALCSDVGWAELSVADDGPGIPVSERTRVFERFVRLDPSRAGAGGGAGLGLAIVRDLVTAHQGSVAVADNAPGATIVVRLPLANARRLRSPAV